MTPIAPHVTAFLRERLPLQRGASEHTCDSYAYAFQLLFQFASKRLRVTPSALYLEQLDAPLVMDFLQYLETERHSSPRTRNARLVAIKSFMRFIEYRDCSACPSRRSTFSRHRVCGSVARGAKNAWCPCGSRRRLTSAPGSRSE